MDNDMNFRECNACAWSGLEAETVHPKHVLDMKLCPSCYETTHVTVAESSPFSIPKHESADKEFVIDGPEGFTLTVDYDDVDHNFQDEMAVKIVRILNQYWK